MALCNSSVYTLLCYVLLLYFAHIHYALQINLMGQLHLLSSTVTTLAVPSPSLLATVARMSFIATIPLALCSELFLAIKFHTSKYFLSEGGGNNPAPAVPLVALGTQNGTIEVVDVVADAVSVSFSVHSSTVRGLRWLGNSRLVSFSYNQVPPCSDSFNSCIL